jgi:hypothetical protein
MLLDIDSTQPTDRILKITRTVYVRAEDADAERRAFNTYWFDEAPPMMIEGIEQIEEGTVESFGLGGFFATDEEATAAALDMSKLFPPAGTVDAWPSTLPADVVLDVLSEIGLGAPEATA